MPPKPCLLCGQPQEIRTEIVRMARTKHYNDIVEWLHDQDVPATWCQVRYFISKYNVPTRFSILPPETTYAAKVRTYIGALLEYDEPTYTIHNIRLRGGSWTIVTVRLHEAGLIEPRGARSSRRWCVLATNDELKAWMKSQTA